MLDVMGRVSVVAQASDFDPTSAVFLSNRSICWIRLGQPEQALADAKAARALNPEWSKACYREGAALRLLQVFPSNSPTACLSFNIFLLKGHCLEMFMETMFDICCFRLQNINTSAWSV